jgi:cell division septum initiation protein DivIVA
VDTDLELVRKGYDPAQVQDLVGKLSSELKALSTENDRLRARATELEQTPPSPNAAADQPDVFQHWSNETNALLDAARDNIAKVHAQAAADAAAVLAAAEVQAAELRHQAQLDAELALGEAQRQADETIAAANLHADTTISEANAHKLATETEAQAALEQTNTQLAQAKAQLADVVQQRAAISKQLGSTKAQLTQLLSLVQPDDEPASATDESAASAEHADDHA